MKRAKLVVLFGLLAAFFGCEQQNAVAPTSQVVGIEALSKKAKGQTNFHFVGLTTAAILDGVHHTMFMAGDGVIIGRKVVGNGTFQHTDSDPAKPVPKVILGEGTWKAKRLVSFRSIGSYGVGVAGVLKMSVVLTPASGAPPLAATLEVVCNIPPAGLFTGKAEGYTLRVAGAPFGAFTALVPPVGVTWFTNTAE
ncbi:MAG: hypothetical protein D6743_14250 [Calditrichaeota bacterium]|nr:MAG: hypothetical protein D6743_14250 [Calditrichota bacterium]